MLLEGVVIWGLPKFPLGYELSEGENVFPFGFIEFRYCKSNSSSFDNSSWEKLLKEFP